MKKVAMRVFSYLLPLTSCLLYSCSLDEHPRDQIAEEEAFSNPEALFRNTVATLYNYIGGNDDGKIDMAISLTDGRMLRVHYRGRIPYDGYY